MNRDWDTELAIATPPITPLWSRNQVPATVSANVNATHLRNFYRRNGAALTFGLADFRVEWTDGRPVDPYGPDGFPDSGDEDMTTRWFGVRPDPDVAVTAVNNVVYKAFKRQQADIAIDQSGLLPFQLAEARRQEQAINDLPVTLRTVFVLREMEGLSTLETADALELTEATVKKRLQRARLWLRERLSEFFVATEEQFDE